MHIFVFLVCRICTNLFDFLVSPVSILCACEWSVTCLFKSAQSHVLKPQPATLVARLDYL